MQLKRLTLALAITASTVFVFSCARQVTRVSPDEAIDISGNWNNTDSRMVADEMTKTILGSGWLSDHLEKQSGKKPVVIVGMVQNKSHEHIDAETFVKDVEKAFLQTQRVRLVQGGKKREELRAEKADQQDNASLSTMKKFGLENGADYILQGSINSIVDSHKRQKVVYYQVNLELTDIQTNEVVWIGEKKIAKYVKN
jgi:penicillin-binding protein activator